MCFMVKCTGMCKSVLVHFFVARERVKTLPVDKSVLCDGQAFIKRHMPPQLFCPILI